MQGLAIRLAKRLNLRLNRRGTVFDDRYFARALTTPLAVRRCLLYVLNNYRRHTRSHACAPRDWADPYSSVDYFDGFQRLASGRRPCAEFSLGRDPPVVPPKTDLLARAWRRHGLLRIEKIPGPTSERWPSRG
jgi:hypothetical protein